MNQTYEAKSDKVKNENGEHILAQAEYDFGDDLKSAVEKFGEVLVFDAYLSAVTIQLQNFMRSSLVKGKTPEEIKALVAGWKPGTVVRVQVDPLTAAFKALEGLDPEARAKFIKDLQIKAKALAA